MAGSVRTSARAPLFCFLALPLVASMAASELPTSSRPPPSPVVGAVSRGVIWPASEPCIRGLGTPGADWRRGSVPPATEAERAHKLVCAYQHATADGTFATLGTEHEFSDLGVIDEPTEAAGDDDYGFTVYTAEELEDMDLKLEYIIDQAFIDKQPLFIGGREKCLRPERRWTCS